VKNFQKGPYSHFTRAVGKFAATEPLPIKGTKLPVKLNIR
jgi:hypothetical protein